jgi:phytoene desaturase
MKKKVVIIGAGIGGLATANLLAKAGFEVDVYEKESIPGGRAGQLKVNGYKFDTGPSWYLMPSVFEHYFELLNEDIKDHLKLKRLDPAYKVFFENSTPLTISSNLKKDAKTFEGIEKGSGDQLKKYVDKSQKIYRASLDHFLYTNFTSIKDFLSLEVLKFGPRMLKLSLQSIDSYVSGYVKDLRLKQVLEYPMVFLGTSPFSAPAIYSLMSALDFEEGVFYPEGGMYKIIEALFNIGKSLGVSFHFNQDVNAIDIKNGVANGIKLKSGKKIAADIVISNSDIYHTDKFLTEEKYRSYSDKYWDKLDPSPSALLMYIGVKGKIKEFEHHNLIFVDEWKKNFDDIHKNKKAPEKASIYISMASKSDPYISPKSAENVFVLVPLPADLKLSKTETEQLGKHYLKQIKNMTRVDLLESQDYISYFGPNDFATKFYSWKSSMLGPSHILKQSAMFRTPNKSKKVKNLYYVGAGVTPGIGLPMCLISAELIYKRLAGDKRGGKVSKLNSGLGEL